MSHLQPLCTH